MRPSGWAVTELRSRSHPSDPAPALRALTAGHFIAKYRYSVALEMRSVLQMSGTEMLLSECIFFAVWTRESFTGIALRPPNRPRARAASKPALVRSWIRRRSNWARLANTLKISSPEAVVVSIAPSQIDLK